MDLSCHGLFFLRSLEEEPKLLKSPHCIDAEWSKWPMIQDSITSGPAFRESEFSSILLLCKSSSLCVSSTAKTERSFRETPVELDVCLLVFPAVA